MTSLAEIYRRFPDRAAAVAHLERLRWPEGPTCPNCGAKTVARKAEASQADRLQCWACQRSFSVLAGTIFAGSHIALQRWYLLIARMLADDRLSASQAARDLCMRRATVSAMMRRIRAAMTHERPLLRTIIHIDAARRPAPDQSRPDAAA